MTWVGGTGNWCPNQQVFSGMHKRDHKIIRNRAPAKYTSNKMSVQLCKTVIRGNSRPIISGNSNKYIQVCNKLLQVILRGIIQVNLLYDKLQLLKIADFWLHLGDTANLSEKRSSITQHLSC